MHAIQSLLSRSGPAESPARTTAPGRQDSGSFAHALREADAARPRPQPEAAQPSPRGPIESQARRPEGRRPEGAARRESPARREDAGRRHDAGRREVEERAPSAPDDPTPADEARGEASRLDDDAATEVEAPTDRATEAASTADDEAGAAPTDDDEAGATSTGAPSTGAPSTGAPLPLPFPTVILAATLAESVSARSGGDAASAEGDLAGGPVASAELAGLSGTPGAADPNAPAGPATDADGAFALDPALTAGQDELSSTPAAAEELDTSALVAEAEAAAAQAEGQTDPHGGAEGQAGGDPAAALDPATLQPPTTAETIGPAADPFAALHAAMIQEREATDPASGLRPRAPTLDPGAPLPGAIAGLPRDPAAPGAVSAPTPSAAPPPPSVLDQVRVAIRPGLNEAHITLSPPELGRVAVRLLLRDGVLEARVEAETQAARVTLERHRHDLESALAQDGAPVRVEVVQTGEGARQDAPFGQAFGQHADQQRGQPGERLDPAPRAPNGATPNRPAAGGPQPSASARPGAGPRLDTLA